MGISTTFIAGTSALFFSDELEDVQYHGFEHFVADTCWHLSDNGVEPNLLDKTDIETYIKDLKKIIIYLNENKINWAGSKLPFVESVFTGVLIVEKERITVVYVHGVDDIEKRVY